MCLGSPHIEKDQVKTTKTLPKKHFEAAALFEPVQKLLENAVCSLLRLESTTSSAAHTDGIYLRCCSHPRAQSSLAEAYNLELEELTRKLFRLHDLNQNGFLEEAELIQLNKKIAMLHYGAGVDKADVTKKYRNLFRSQFDAAGQPVAYPIFGTYMRQVLTEIDPDVQAQIMIMEQFISEASLARKFVHVSSMESLCDAPFVEYLCSSDELTIPRGDTIPEIDIDEALRLVWDNKDITLQVGWL